jgi:hypothetical protein
VRRKMPRRPGKASTVSRPRVYTLIVLENVPDADLRAGDVLTLDPTAAVPLVADGGRLVSTVEYIPVLVAMHGQQIVAEPSTNGARTVLWNVLRRAEGLRTSTRRTLAGSAGAVRAALKAMLDLSAVPPSEPSGVALSQRAVRRLPPPPPPYDDGYGNFPDQSGDEWKRG